MTRFSRFTTTLLIALLLQALRQLKSSFEFIAQLCSLKLRAVARRRRHCAAKARSSVCNRKQP